MVYVSMVLGTMHGVFFTLIPLMSASCTRFHTIFGSITQIMMLISIHTLSKLTAVTLLALIVYFVLALGFLEKFWIDYNLVQSLNLIIIAAYVLLTAFNK